MFILPYFFFGIGKNQKSFSCSSLKDVERSLALEFELDILGGQSLVDVGDDINFIFKELFAVLVQEDFLDAGSISLVSDSSSDNTTWKDQIIKNSVVDSSQGSASGSLLGFMDLVPLGLDGSLGDEDDGSLELLFDFGDELFGTSSDEGKAWEGDGDNEGVLSLLSLSREFELLDTSDVDVFKIRFQFGGAVFEVVESSSNSFFMSVGLVLASLIELVQL
mmetsp:Transcript_22172/g.18983  ORF Transcript_22172/g.18983 Transcript_22172/m.18983 type:complete len:220 (+) Transcript_22172:500-1159(+)